MKNTSPNIAIVGMACRYPDARNTNELWENILAQRRAFRQIPNNRLGEEYFSTNDDDKDKIYSRIAAVISAYNFDRGKFKVSGENYRSTDLTHWLALEVATEALEHAGLIGQQNLLPNKHTGVYVGNTLTGEFSRSNIMRLRWPYVAKTITAQLDNEGWGNQKIGLFLYELEKRYKSSFPEMQEDSLAGGLSNTIAGRICNHFDFNGGGYTVDGACSSSLLAVINACKALESGDLKVALAGGVDLSLDPFELVGFSRTGALARKEMLVYDKNANGFWPGEGCGFVVLADEDFAKENGLHILAWLKGWGMSSDGKGGLTRPTVKGQSLAMQRAYAKAQYLPSDVTYFEGHGTGTKVGDEVELSTIIENIKNGNISTEKLHYISSIKSNIGHTKAAAGIAGLIKAIKVLENRIIPPIANCKNKHRIFDDSPLELPSFPILYQGDKTLKAGVSAMGFGGINTHLTIEENNSVRRIDFTSKEKKLSTSFQDCELFLFDADNLIELKEKISKIECFAHLISFAEMGDLSHELFKNTEIRAYRAAVIASSPKVLGNKLRKLIQVLDTEKEHINTSNDIYFYVGKPKNRIGFLFPGQGSRSYQNDKTLSNRFPFIQKFVPDTFPKCAYKKLSSTRLAQPAIAGTAIIANKLLHTLGVKGDIGIGHSLGEISALYWAGVFDESHAFDIAKQRGGIMEDSKEAKGKMLSIGMPYGKVAPYIQNKDVVIAAMNTEKQTVVSGSTQAVLELKAALETKNIPSILLHVENAFHAPQMKFTSPLLQKILEKIQFAEPIKKVISTVTGQEINTSKQIKNNLINQLTQPVLFLQAVSEGDKNVDCWIELGGGNTLQKMVKNISNKPAVSLELDGSSVKGMLKTIGMLWVLGNTVDIATLFEHRFYRKFSLDWKPSFITNPCENFQQTIPVSRHNGVKTTIPYDNIQVAKKSIKPEKGLMIPFRKMIAKHLELPLEDILQEYKMLEDLHLNSLQVGQFIARFASEYGIKMTKAPTEYANASIIEIVEMLELGSSENNDLTIKDFPGIAPWIHLFEIKKVQHSLHQNTNIQQATKGAIWHYMRKEGANKNQFKEFSIPEENGILLDLLACNEEEVIVLICKLINLLKSVANIKHIVVLQSDRGLASGFIKSIFLANKQFNVLILNTNQTTFDTPTLKTEITNNKGFSEIFYTDNKRYLPIFQPVFTQKKPKKIALTHQDVIIVSGGGKGITAECAIALAKRYNVKLALLGRSNPDGNVNLQNNLKRIESQGIDFQYYIADITCIKTLKETIKNIQKELGNITGFMHGAGINQPVEWQQLNIEKINHTLSPKLYGFRNITQCLDTDSLKFVISFGSIIATSGMPGNADYAMANECLRIAVADFADAIPHCQCLNAEWSVWSGAGMGENLGVLENLLRQDIHPINLEEGVQIFLSWFDKFPSTTNLIISGRYGKMPTLRTSASPISPLRYLEDICLLYPGIEIIIEFEISLYNDLYLADHMVEEQYVFPAVMGMEAMSQAVKALGVDTEKITFRNVQFLFPITVGDKEPIKVRLLAYRKSSNSIKAVLRCSTTAFSKDHFQATILLHNEKPDCKLNNTTHNMPQIDVAKDIYGDLLFHKGIFQCIKTYEHLTPYHCIVQTTSDRTTKYFSDFLPAKIISNEPVMRDTMLHAVQACVPEYQLLPVGVDTIYTYSSINSHAEYEIEAVEISRNENIFIYDIFLRDSAGVLIEYWASTTFKTFSSKRNIAMPLDLARVLLQRRIDECIGIKNEYQLNTNTVSTHFEILKRYDGKPLLRQGNISKSNTATAEISLVSPAVVGCDLEEVHQMEQAHWKTLLGENRYAIAKYLYNSFGEDLSIGSTRIWGVMECMKKAELNIIQTITFDKQENDKLYFFTCEEYRFLSYCFSLKETQSEVIFTALLGKINQR